MQSQTCLNYAEVRPKMQELNAESSLLELCGVANGNEGNEGKKNFYFAKIFLTFVA
ncbi:MAG: hypothetical protein KBT06_02710 [Prevotellaceae bacterium]|nr:hypothetical protein [Candidatus Colivivens equi]